MISTAIRRKPFFRQVFTRAAWEDPEPEPATASSVEALQQRCEDAFRAREVDIFIELAAWRLQRGLLDRKSAERLAAALGQQGRWSQALAVLRDERGANPKKPSWQRALAAALAGSGQLEAAGEALAQARTLQGEGVPADDEFAQALALVSGGAAEPASWRDAAELAQAWLMLGLERRAGDALVAAAGRAPPASEDEVLDVLRLAQDTLQLAEPDVARTFFEAMAPRLERWPELEGHNGVQLFRALMLSKAGRDEEAIGLLAPLAGNQDAASYRGAEYARQELANCIGQQVLAETRPRLTRTNPSGPRRIVDMFPMNDELLMLRLKLEEMGGWVDRFVIVESRFTFQGEPKPLHFERSRAMFADFADRIAHVVVDEPPAWARTPWTREYHQRDCGVRALPGLCGPDDLVLVTDVDEIVDRRVIERLDSSFSSLSMPTYAYFFNLQVVEARQRPWAAVLKARHLQRIGASYAKIGIPQHAKSHDLPDAGWHFSSVRDADGLVSKFDSYSNTHLSGHGRGHFQDILARIRSAGGLDGHRRLEIDDSFPGYLRAHASELRELIL
jgi:tetratricopeptide (TPR) repeat protein